MSFFKKLIGLFENSTENAVEDCRTQSKPTITTISVSPSHTPTISPRAFDVIVVGVHYYQEALGRIKFYLRYPRQLRVDLLNQAKEKIGEIRNKEPVLRIIKAFYNGYDLDLEVETLYGLYTQYDAEFDTCVGETVRYATVAIVPKKED